MEQIKGYDDVEVIKGATSNVLPKGGYQMVILGATLKDSSKGGKYLCFDMDIAEGEYKGFFDRLYSESTSESKTWRCKYYLTVPDGSGSDKDTFKTRVFKTFMKNVEESNSGYAWNWNEGSLCGKMIGGLFVGNEYMAKDGQIRNGTILAKTCPLQDIVDGTFKLPKDKVLSSSNGFVEVGKAELPFS